MSARKVSATFLPRVFERMGIYYGWAVVGVVFLTMLSTSAAMGIVGVLMLPSRPNSVGIWARFRELLRCVFCCLAWQRRLLPPSCSDTGSAMWSRRRWH